jgi:hypothetical protein
MNHESGGSYMLGVDGDESKGGSGGVYRSEP